MNITFHARTFVFVCALALLLSDCGKIRQLADGGKTIQGNTYCFVLPKDWTKDASTPKGYDFSFTRKFPGEREANISVFSDLLTEGQDLPSNYGSVAVKAWDAASLGIHKDSIPFDEPAPNIGGSLLFDRSYNYTKDGTKITQRITEILIGRIKLNIQFTSPQTERHAISKEIHSFLGSFEKSNTLLTAVLNNDVSSVTKLIKSGINVNEPEMQDGLCALHYAAGNGNEAIVKLLLEAGADPSRRGVLPSVLRSRGDTLYSLTPQAFAVGKIRQIASVLPITDSTSIEMLKLASNPDTIKRYERVNKILADWVYEKM